MLASRWAWKDQVETKLAEVGPKTGTKGLPGLSCRIWPLFGAPFWAHLRPISGYLGPSPALLGGVRGQEGLLRQMLGLEGLILGYKVAKG